METVTGKNKTAIHPLSIITITTLKTKINVNKTDPI